jgi:ATP-dependent Lon protease
LRSDIRYNSAKKRERCYWVEVTGLPRYTECEKLHVAMRFLIAQQLKQYGLASQQLEIRDEAVLAVIRNYTSEAGLRNLEREIGTICRKLPAR